MKSRFALIMLLLGCLCACTVDEPEVATISINEQWLAGEWQLTRKVIDYNVIVAGITWKSECIDDTFSIGHRDTFGLEPDHTFLVNSDTAGTWGCHDMDFTLDITNPEVDYYNDLSDIGLDTKLSCRITAQDSSRITLYYFGQKNIIVGNLNAQIWFYLEK